MSRIVSLTCVKGHVNLVTPEDKYFVRCAPLHAGVLATADDLRSKFPKAANGGLLEVVNDLRKVVKVSDAADEALVKLYGATDQEGQVRSLRALNDALSRTRDSLDGIFGSLLMGDSLPKVRAHFVTSASYALLQVAIAHGLTDPDETAKVTLFFDAQRTFETSCKIVFEK
jgi:hypothetical protein